MVDEQLFGLVSEEDETPTFLTRGEKFHAVRAFLMVLGLEVIAAYLYGRNPEKLSSAIRCPCSDKRLFDLPQTKNGKYLAS